MDLSRVETRSSSSDHLLPGYAMGGVAARRVSRGFPSPGAARVDVYGHRFLPHCPLFCVPLEPPREIWCSAAPASGSPWPTGRSVAAHRSCRLLNPECGVPPHPGLLFHGCARGAGIHAQV